MLRSCWQTSAQPRCFVVLFVALADGGFFPHRLSMHSMRPRLCGEVLGTFQICWGRWYFEGCDECPAATHRLQLSIGEGVARLHWDKDWGSPGWPASTCAGGLRPGLWLPKPDSVWGQRVVWSAKLQEVRKQLGHEGSYGCVDSMDFQWPLDNPEGGHRRHPVCLFAL